MFTRKAAVGLAALALTAPTLALVTPATAADLPDTRISARVSDSTPASGQTFRVRGRFFEDGAPATGEVVKIQAWRDGKWVQLTGARVTTNDEGRYGMRLILSQKGKRLLRAVGVADSKPNAYRKFTVRVH